jgi:hypothetical protein
MDPYLLRDKRQRIHFSERSMSKLMPVILLWLAALPAFGQSASTYQVGTITAVKPHQSAVETGSDAVSYDVSLRVGDTIYQLVYTPPLGASSIKYAAGRNLLVLVGENTIRYNNIAGESFEVPIVSRESANDGKQPRQASQSGLTK